MGSYAEIKFHFDMWMPLIVEAEICIYNWNLWQNEIFQLVRLLILKILYVIVNWRLGIWDWICFNWFELLVSGITENIFLYPHRHYIHVNSISIFYVGLLPGAYYLQINWLNSWTKMLFDMVSKKNWNLKLF